MSKGLIVLKNKQEIGRITELDNDVKLKKILNIYPKCKGFTLKYA